MYNPDNKMPKEVNRKKLSLALSVLGLLACLAYCYSLA